MKGLRHSMGPLAALAAAVILVPLALAGVEQPAAAAKPAAAPAPGQILLGYVWNSVVSARYQVVTVERTRTVKGGATRESTKRTETEVRLGPAGVEGPMTWLEVQLLRQKIDFDPEGVSADSAAAENPKARAFGTLPSAYKAIADKKFRVLVTPGGRPKKIEGLQDVVSAAKATFPEGWPDRDAVLAAMMPTSDAAVSGQLAGILLYLPGRAVDPSFEKSEKVPSPTGAGQLDQRIALAGNETKDGRETVVIRQTLDGKDLPPVPVAGQGITVVTPVYTGATTVWLDPKLGIPVRLESKSSRSQVVRADGADPSATPQATVDTDISVETSLLEAQPK